MSFPDPRHVTNYPDPVYQGESGEASATYRPVTQAPELSRTNVSVHYLATGRTTGGKFGLYRYEMGPGRGGPGPHFHRTLTESFYVLSGTVRIYDGKSWVDTEPGDWVHVPEGGVHGFRNESGAPASMLIHFSPGAPREAYFEGLANLAEMSEEDRLAFYLEHDNIWLPDV